MSAEPHHARLQSATAPVTLSIWPGSPGAGATPGRDLVLELPLEHGISLARGAALDDHLDAESCLLVDRRARERYERWRKRRSAELTVGGLDLPASGELDLLAQCFVPAARVEVGLPRALAAVGARAIALHGVSDGMEGVLRATAAQEGISAVETRQVSGGKVQRWSPGPLAARGAAALGFPGRVRGDVVCVPYWNLTPVFRRFVEGNGRTRPVASGIALPGIGPTLALRGAARGGWVGHPGARKRRRARQAVAAAVSAARAQPAGLEPLDAAVDAWALSYLSDRAASALAGAWQARRAFATGSVRGLLVPFDGPQAMAALVAEARRAGFPSLLAQHGFDAELGVPDKTHVDAAALWSERDLSLVPADAGVRTVVTGNPGAEHLASPSGRVPRRDRTLVLVDYHSLLSARVTTRISQQHVAAALDAIARARPGSRVLIRPHPGSRGAEAYLAWPDGLSVEVDSSTPIEELFTRVDACVGAMSTATLQAAAHGVPVVYLDVAAIDRPWPFDGTAVPVARNADELADALTEAVARTEVAGQAEMVEALGARAGATAAVCDLVLEMLAAGGSARR